MTNKIIPKIKYFFFDGTKVIDKESFFKEIATAMNFPNVFGHTWNTFAYDINNLQWVKEPQSVLIWVAPTDFKKNYPEDFKLAVSLIIKASEFFRIHNVNTHMWQEEDDR